ncbi:MAG: polysaccharide pyruvyl transferase family protein [Candidatus Odinarchaeia archaeon]
MKDNTCVIFIIGSYGAGNIGDDLMLFYLIKELNNKIPEVSFIVTRKSLGFYIPQNTKVSGVNILHFHRLVLSIFKAKIVMLGGGTQIHDNEGRTKWFYILLYKIILLTITKILRKPIIYSHIGIGPFTSSWGNIFGVILLRLADLIIVRDKMSFNYAAYYGVSNKTVLSFDLSILMGKYLSYNNKPVFSFIDGEKKDLGIVIFPYYEIYDGLPDKDISLLLEIKNIINIWLSKNKNSKVYLLSFNSNSLIQKKYNELIINKNIEVFPYTLKTNLLLEKIKKCNLMICMPFHSILLTYLSKKPMIVIKYHNKCKSLANYIGLSNKAIIDLNDLKGNDLEIILKRYFINPHLYTSNLNISEAITLAENGLTKAIKLILKYSK